MNEEEAKKFVEAFETMIKKLEEHEKALLEIVKMIALMGGALEVLLIERQALIEKSINESTDVIVKRQKYPM